MGVQIPNGGFEEWYSHGKYENPYPSPDKEFWSTGNEGASKAGATVTTRVSDPRPGSAGQYAACLKTTFAGVGIIGKLAAGNVFVGSFGETNLTQMTGTVYMGRTFTFNAKPKALRVWYKGSLVKSDKSRVYVCLTHMTKPGCTYHTVNTAEPDATTFQPDDEFLYTNKKTKEDLEGHIIAYGDHMIEQSQGEWTMVEIPIIYRDTYASEKPNVLILTASASYRGDYFEGEEGTTLYLDDIEFVYE